MCFSWAAKNCLLWLKFVSCTQVQISAYMHTRHTFRLYSCAFQTRSLLKHVLQVVKHTSLWRAKRKGCIQIDLKQKQIQSLQLWPLFTHQTRHQRAPSSGGAEPELCSERPWVRRSSGHRAAQTPADSGTLCPSRSHPGLPTWHKALEQVSTALVPPPAPCSSGLLRMLEAAGGGGGGGGDPSPAPSLQDRALGRAQQILSAFKAVQEGVCLQKWKAKTNSAACWFKVVGSPVDCFKVLFPK